MSQQSSVGSVRERDMWEELRWSRRFIVIMQEDTENAIGENKTGINWVNCLRQQRSMRKTIWEHIWGRKEDCVKHGL